MSAFTEAEIAYLSGQRLGRLATVGPDGQPHITPVTFVYNAEEDAVDVGGINFGASKKWRDASAHPRVCFLVDESWGTGAKAVEIRGEAEAHETGGDAINPRFTNFAPEFLRIRPRRIVAWGVDVEATGADFKPNARNV